MITEMSLLDYAKKTNSQEPTPGGGSVSAYAGALGAALTNMVAHLSYDKKSFKNLEKDIQDEMKAMQKKMDEIYEALLQTTDEDTRAFDGVMKAYALPKETEEEKKVRDEAIQEGYRHALAVPLKAAETALSGLRIQKVFADYGNRYAITDVGAGAILLHSAVEGSLLNVLINLNALTDEDFRKEIEKKVKDIQKEADSLRKETMKTVYERI